MCGGDEMMARRALPVDRAARMVSVYFVAMLSISFPTSAIQDEEEPRPRSRTSGLYQVFAEVSDPSHIRSDVGRSFSSFRTSRRRAPSRPAVGRRDTC